LIPFFNGIFRLFLRILEGFSGIFGGFLNCISGTL